MKNISNKKNVIFVLVFLALILCLAFTLSGILKELNILPTKEVKGLVQTEQKLREVNEKTLAETKFSECCMTKINEVKLENNISSKLNDYKLDGKIEAVKNYVKNELMPLLTGLATAIVTILAMLVPYVKTIGKLKQTQSAYSTVYDEHEKLLDTYKSMDSEGSERRICNAVTKEVSENMAKYNDTLARVLGQEEILSAQVATLVEGAKLAWHEADGASMVLAKSPTATALEKQSLTVNFLKSIIADELGMKREELETKIDKELGL